MELQFAETQVITYDWKTPIKADTTITAIYKDSSAGSDKNAPNTRDTSPAWAVSLFALSIAALLILKKIRC